MKAKELAEKLLQYPEANVIFEEDKYFGDTCLIPMDGIMFTKDEVLFPNLCPCFPEPD